MSVASDIDARSLSNRAPGTVSLIDDPHPWNEYDGEDMTMEMVTDIGEGSGDEEVRVLTLILYPNRTMLWAPLLPLRLSMATMLATG